MCNTEGSTLAPGARINWLSNTAQMLAAPGVVRKLGPKQVQIELREQEPYGSRRWIPRLKWVPKASVTPRHFPCAAFHESMFLEQQGHILKAWRHPGGGRTLFPAGIWYGEIDGYSVGAPCASEEAAVQQAHQIFTTGRYH